MACWLAGGARRLTGAAAGCRRRLQGSLQGIRSQPLSVPPPPPPQPADTYYPINTAQCCTPALLLENGDAWELERCGCHDRCVECGWWVGWGLPQRVGSWEARSSQIHSV